MAAAYLQSKTISMPAQFCAWIPYDTRRMAAAALRGAAAPGHVFKCDRCNHWHIGPVKKGKANG